MRRRAAPKSNSTASRRPVALAAGSLVVLALALAAQRAHAADEATTTPLLPTRDPCGSCDRPLAQASSSSIQSLPETPAPAATFRLNDVLLNGAQALTADELKAITQPYIGRDVTLADLETLAQAITAQYRARGYFLAQALVPVQTVQGGVVEISVIEGRLGKVEVLVAPDAPITEARVRGFLAPLVPGQPVNAPTYERAMLLLSDQPGLRVSSALQEGMEPGTTDLSVEVAGVRRWTFAAEADNHGTEESGEYRIGGTVRWLSPFGIGDNLDARALVANDNGLWFGRLAYEAPIGGNGLRAGVGLSRVNYELGGQFENLNAHGVADVFDVSLNYPLIRQRQQNLFLRLGADEKHLRDELDAVNFSGRKKVRGVGLGWTWERRDEVLGGGYWASAGTLYRGKLYIEDPISRTFDQSPAGHNTEGNFSKLAFQVSRLQAIVPRHSLYLSVGGQWSDKNLDAS
ncbi:MAG: ShlB/FhaC/HecB family hemolysin secretion/activation protein, partial [Variovorax sp.]